MYGYIFTDFGEEYQILNTGIEEEKINISGELKSSNLIYHV